MKQRGVRARRIAGDVNEQERPLIELVRAKDAGPKIRVDRQRHESSIDGRRRDRFSCLRQLTAARGFDDDPPWITIASMVHRLE